MATIPEVRDDLARIAAAMRASPDPDMWTLAVGIDQAIDSLFRRKVFRKAPIKASPPTQPQRQAVREIASAFPTMSQLEIGREVGRRFGIDPINPGRISEILRGKRQ